MSNGDPKRGFALRPSAPDAWVRTPDKRGVEETNTARLTIDVTPALRARIKVTAFQRGQTVAHMIRALLECEFPDNAGDVP